MNITTVIEYLVENGIPFFENVDLKKKTWIHRGGVARIFIQPELKSQLAEVVKFLYTNVLDFLVIGHTSNLYIRNTTNIPIVISTQRCNHYSLANGIIYCEAGVSVIKLANEMVSKGIKGFEYLTALPGTVGAALINNSSCNKNSISSLLIEAEVVMQDGNTVILKREDFGFKFRESNFKSRIMTGTIINMKLKAEKGDTEKLKETALFNSEKRKAIIESNASNLGCTVNSCFCIGKMPIVYRLFTSVYNRILGPLLFSKCQKLSYYKILCKMTGCRNAANYISLKNPIIFIWKDDGADEAFPFYLRLMRKVYKTDKLEIEVY